LQHYVAKLGSIHVENIPVTETEASFVKKSFTLRRGTILIPSPVGEDSYIFDRKRQPFTLHKGMYLKSYAFAKEKDYRFETLQEAQKAVLASKRQIGGITVESIPVTVDGFSSDERETEEEEETIEAVENSTVT
jgi:hypothetical protein